MPSFKYRVYTSGDTSIPAWIRELDKNQNHEYGYEIVIKSMQTTIDKLTYDLNFSKKHAENLHNEVVRRGNLMVERCDRIEELEHALRYLHDSVASYYPNFIKSPAMMTASDALMKEENK